ncbi:hypothetical protein GH714_041895 [Hevea brasiliensis]|uniref:Uncharacterized protein n=1 Tax=Hevea brasiliensis TaxID=3981 RepID=A0A6A6MTR2_HEVBR|nr:hypothetical protein GH714_041895 [Hevea brasiliensis]
MDESCEISDATGISLETDKIEKPCFRVGEEETSREDRISNKVEEKTTNAKEISCLQKDEEDRPKENEDVEHKQASIVEASSESPIKLSEKIEIPNMSVDELNATHSLEQGTGVVEGEELGGVTDFEPQDQVKEEEKSVEIDTIIDDGIPKVEDLGTETSQIEVAASLAEGSETTQDIHQEERTSDGTLENQISREIELEMMISTGKQDVPLVLQEPVVQTTQVIEVGGSQTVYDTDVDSDVKGVEHGAQNIVDEKDGKAIEETVSRIRVKFSLFDMMQNPREKGKQLEN